jgi:L-rhamnose-H+ transport protein
MSSLIAGLLLILVAGILQGTWALGVKRSEPLSWEALWAPFSFIGMIVIPFVWVSIVIPDLRAILDAIPPEVIWVPFLYGAGWGIGAVTFGLAIKYIGMSLSYGVNMGIASSAGALIPFFMLDNLRNDLVMVVVAGTIVMLVGVILITRAGILREKYQGKDEDQIVGEGHTRIGIILAIVGGLSTASFNIGFSKALPVVDVAVEMGATTANGSLIAWLFVLTGGFILNFGYAFFLLVRNKSFSNYTAKGSGKGILVMVVTAIAWFAAIGIYGQGAAVMGELGPIAGWIMFMALALIVSNLWGLRTGEWKGMVKPLKYLYAGNIILILSWVILGWANTL